MIHLETILTKLGEHEYLGDDGLIYCNHCNKPRQVRLNFLDRMQTVRCLCPCQQAQINGRYEQLHKQEELDRISRIKSAAMEDPALRNYTFANSDYDNHGLQIARTYVEQWPLMLEKGQGLLLWGPTGTGKTYIAACIANAILDQGIPVLITSLGRMLGAMPGPTSGEQTSTIDQWMQYPLLIIDDLGAERESAYTTELVYHIIDSRYRSGKPLIITTNLTMKQLENPPSIDRARIYQRILERCTPVCIDGTDIRRDKRLENRDFARKHLQ